MKLLLVLFFFWNIPGAFAQDSFLKACQAPGHQSEGVQNDIRWYKLLYKTDDCQKIAKTLSKLVDLGHFFFNYSKLKKNDSLELPTNWTSSFPEFYANDTNAANLYEKNSTTKFGELFTDLSIYKDFKNITHVNYTSKERFLDRLELCRLVATFPSLTTVSLPLEKLTKEVDDCLAKREIKVIILGVLERLSDFKPRSSIIGIENFHGQLTELLPFSDLRYLGVSEDKASNNGSPSSIGDLSTLTELSHISFNLSNMNAISEIGKINKLEWLSISCLRENREDKPGTCGKQVEIKNLEFLNKLVWLKELNLSFNNIENFDAVRNLKRLKILKLSGNRFKEVPALDGFSELIYLDLGGNQITGLENLRGLKKLQFVNLSANSLSDLSIFSELPNLIFLNLSYNQAELELPTINSKSIRVLNLSGRCPSFETGLGEDNRLLSQRMRTIPFYPFEMTGDLERMYNDSIAREFRFGEFEIRLLNSVSPKIGNAGSKKCDLPPLVTPETNFQKLPALEVLVLRNQRIQTLPDLSTLKRLLKLDVQGNLLTNFTNFKSHLLLQELDLSYNAIHVLPSFGQFPSLKMIDLTANDLRNISSLQELLKTNDHMRLDFSYAHIDDLRMFNRKEYKNFYISLNGNLTVKRNCPENTKNADVLFSCLSQHEDWTP